MAATCSSPILQARTAAAAGARFSAMPNSDCSRGRGGGGGGGGAAAPSLAPPRARAPSPADAPLCEELPSLTSCIAHRHVII